MAKALKPLNVYFTQESFVIEDLSIEDNASLQGWKTDYKEDKYKWLFQRSFEARSDLYSPAMNFMHHIGEGVIEKITHMPDLEISRDQIEPEWTQEDLDVLLEGLPFAVGMEWVNHQWLSLQCMLLVDVFRQEIKAFDGRVKRYLSNYSDALNIVGRVYFHLVESKDEDFPFAFMATYSTKADASTKAIHTPLKNALKEFEDDQDKLLSLISTVVKASYDSPFISDLLESGDLFAPIKLKKEEAYDFLKDINIYEASGIKCRIPNWWKKKTNRLGVSLNVGEKPPSRVGLKALIDFNAEAVLDGQKISETALRALLNMAEGLTLYKGKWIEVNHQRMASVLKALEDLQGHMAEDGLTVGEAMSLQFRNLESLPLDLEGQAVEVSHGQWLKNISSTMTTGDFDKSTRRPPSFHADLRHYQEAGYRWLHKMDHLGFGACLADDMGLGKTVQVIAFLEHARVYKGGRALLVLPASLLGNWQREIEKFAPDLSYQVVHSSHTKVDGDFKLSDHVFLTMTSYGMAKKVEAFKDHVWDYLILDEAQGIKNPSTKQSKAIKAIPCKMPIAMTGTPIENKLGDLWSLFDFLNKGLLGTPKEFGKFTKNLSDHPEGYAKLRQMIQPFILRRMKTDKSIIADLPDKIEMNAYPTLTKKQVVLYKKLVKDLEHSLDQTEGIQRRGLVLSSLMKFKQICNHPDQYLSRDVFKASDSGKFMQLKEICETIYDKRERVLVFTQFKEMTQVISDFLKEIFKAEGLVLHGSTPVKKRQAMVETFNAEAYMPYMVLSLKAGGVGLNLTAANHVIHFDRWWNPAVENQATDRAYRIGQEKNVMVHKFVTKGTLEEKIDAMLMEKDKLSGDLLSSGGEQWITEYTSEELMKIFTLGGE